MPLGDPSLIQPVVMVNLLSDLWRNGEPDWARLLAHSRIKLHLYGKKPSHPGRKMGHFLYFAEPSSDALEQAEMIFRTLSPKTSSDASPVTDYHEDSSSQVFQA